MHLNRFDGTYGSSATHYQTGMLRQGSKRHIQLTSFKDGYWTAYLSVKLLIMRWETGTVLKHPRRRAWLLQERRGAGTLQLLKH
jgi:hypothetical protein